MSAFRLGLPGQPFDRQSKYLHAESGRSLERSNDRLVGPRANRPGDGIRNLLHLLENPQGSLNCPSLPIFRDRAFAEWAKKLSHPLGLTHGFNCRGSDPIGELNWLTIRGPKEGRVGRNYCWFLVSS